MTIRVLVIDDSRICRAQLREILQRDSDISVVGEAENGDDALRLIDESTPQLLVVDLQMPGTGGHETIERVMAHRPLPILIVTGQPEGVRQRAVFESIRRGALDLAEKPAHGDEAAGQRLRALVRQLWRVPVVRHVAGKLARRDGSPVVPANVPSHLPSTNKGSRLVVGVAASAGGPKPLVTLIASWPADFAAAVAVVQHLPNGFAPAFAEFLQSRVPQRVVIVTKPTRLEAGHVYLATDDRHLIATDDRHLAPEGSDPVDGHRPAASTLFASLARRFADRACGVILSGMGRDGVTGLLELKARGGLTLAQEERGCAVYGMPKAAREAGACSAALDPPSLAREIADWADAQSNPPGAR